MRVIFFFFNSALLTIHFVLTAVVLAGFLPLSTKTQESDLYGSTLLVVEFSNATSAFTNLYGFPLVLMLALVLGIYSRKDNKLDRKFFFSKKGFLFNTLFAIFMSVTTVVVSNTSSSFDETAHAESELERLYIDKKTDLNTIIAFAPDETPASFESRLIASQDIEIQQVLNTNFDHKCGWQDEVSPSFYGDSRLLIVPVNQIKKTVDLFKSDYSIDESYCQKLIDAERRAREEKAGEAAELDKKIRKRKQEDMRRQADELCRKVFGGCS